MMLVFCGLVAYTASMLSESWKILEHRWPEQYLKPARTPYMEMAFRAFGSIGKNIALVCVIITQYGGTAVFIILSSQMAFSMVDKLSTCEWILVIGGILIPCTWLGTPKDFWMGPLVATVSTIIAVIVVVVQTIIEAPSVDYEVQYANATVGSFSLGFGAILFAYGGSSVFPTIQNDMHDRKQFWKSVCLGFIFILSLYIPLSVSGYAVFGSSVNANILFQVHGPVVNAAKTLQIINLIGSYVIGFNTVSQSVEEMLGIPTDFNWKRVVSRTTIVLSQMVIGLAIPDFSLILNLIGGSATTACTFILPPLIYLKLCDMDPEQKIEVPLWAKVLLIEAVIIGSVGGLGSTVSAFQAIFNQAFSESCFTKFT